MSLRPSVLYCPNRWVLRPGRSRAQNCPKRVKRKWTPPRPSRRWMRRGTRHQPSSRGAYSLRFVNVCGLPPRPSLKERAAVLTEAEVGRHSGGDGADRNHFSATGYLTGNQEKQTEGNLENEKAQWAYKQASSDRPLDIPVPSAKGVEGKVESVVGMVTGDAEKQKQGNVKAENAAWADGV